VAQKFTVPITVKQLSSAGSDAVTVYVDQDTYARLKIEAGGRLTWGDGSAVGDVNLYRDSANVLRTDDVFRAPVLFVDSIEIDTTGATTNQVLKFDGTKFAPGTAGSSVVDLDDLTDVSAFAPTDGYFLKYVSASSSWVPSAIPTINSLDDVGNVSVPSPTTGQILVYNGTNWVNQDNTAALLDIDGGTNFEEIFEAELTNMIEAVYDGGVF
jgi:hypothetical protein